MSPPDDLDSPWKEAQEHFLPPFLAFFFPAVHADLDWSRGYESLDKELQQIMPSARTGKRLADKLFKIWRHNGREAWLLIHIEIQGQPERAFAERMFQYSYRIYDRYHKPVASLAVLCDSRPNWRPDRFEYDLWGCRVGLRFLTAKLLDYGERAAELERDKNPFAAVVLANLKALETKDTPQTRWEWKVRLIKGLYDRGLDAEQIRQLFRVIDWMLQLPEELEQLFKDEIYQFEEERRMPYVTSVERLAREEGREKGLVEGMRKVLIPALESKFGAKAKRLLLKIEALQDPEKLQAVADALKTAERIEDLRALLR